MEDEQIEGVTPVAEETAVVEEVKRKFKYNKSGLIWPSGREGGIPPGGTYQTLSGRKYIVDEQGCHRRAN